MLRLSGFARNTTSYNFRNRCFSSLNHVPTASESIVDTKTSNLPSHEQEGKETTAKQPSKPFKSTFEVYDENKPRFNDFNIQMIPKSMSHHLFGKSTNNVSCNMQELNKAITELKKHGLMSNVKETPEVRFNLPKLEGKTIEDHFFNIGEYQSAPYRMLVLSFLS